MSGIFAVYNDERQDVYEDIYFGLYALQHRGQASVGIATKSKRADVKIGQGLIKDNFTYDDKHDFKGDKGLGFVKYQYKDKNLDMPIVMDDIILAMDGVVLNEDFSILKLLNHLQNDHEALIEYVRELKGAFTIVYITEDTLIAIRDNEGIKPLCLGRKGQSTLISSESCSIDVIDGVFERDFKRGEIFIKTKEGETSYVLDDEEPHTCAFEYIYFSRQDSNIDGISIYEARQNMGRQLYLEDPLEDMIVIGAPDSGIIAALGYAEASGLEFKEGFVRNRYIGRTFINHEAEARARGVKIKLTPIRQNIEGKDVILVDDSIVRGTTITKTVQNLKNSGARSVHVRIAAPPVVNHNSVSIDVPANEDLIAHNRNLEQMVEYIGCDSLKFLSLEGLHKATGKKKFYYDYFLKSKEEL